MGRIKGNISKEERKKIILKSALIAFCKLGYDGTNIEDIAREANCSHGLIYYYFENKTDIFKVLTAQAAKYSASVQELFSIDEQKTSEENLLKITENLLSILRKDDNAFYYLQFSNIMRMLKDVEELGLKGEDIPKFVTYDVVRTIFESGLKENKFKSATPEICAECYFALIYGLAMRKATSKERNEIIVLPEAKYLVNFFTRQEIQ